MMNNPFLGSINYAQEQHYLLCFDQQKVNGKKSYFFICRSHPFGVFRIEVNLSGLRATSKRVCQAVDQVEIFVQTN